MNPIGSQPLRKASLGLAFSLMLTTLAPVELLAAASWFSRARSPQDPEEPLGAKRLPVSSQTVFDVTISLYNRPSGDDDPGSDFNGEQQTVYEKIVRSWADGVCEASNGAHKLGTVRIFRQGSFPAADVIWNEREHPRATPSGFGVSGEQIVFGDVFADGKGFGKDLRMLDDPQAAGYLLAHEWAVYAYGLYSEYRGRDDGSHSPFYAPRSSDVPVEPSIMSNPWRAAVSGGGELAWLNFSTPNSYQPETSQARVYGASGWEVLARNPKDDPSRRDLLSTLPRRVQYSSFSAVQPTAAEGWVRIELPDPGCRSELAIEWMDQDLELELVIDRSISLDGKPLDIAKAAARALVDAVPLKVTALGVVSFDDTVRQDVPITPIFTAFQQTSIGQTIGGITPGGDSAVFDAARQALAYLQDYRAAHHTRARRAVFLLTDGRDNSSAESKRSVTQAYLAAGVPLITLGYGDFAPEGVLRQLADDTGGLFYASPTQLAEIQNALLTALSSVSSTLTLTTFQESIPADSTLSLGPFQVDSTLRSVTLLVNYEGPPNTLQFSGFSNSSSSCRSLAGTTGCVVQVDTLGATGAQSFRARNASNVPVVVSGSVLANPGPVRTYDLKVASASGSTVTYPEPIVVTAAVSQGVRITSLDVTATITRPDGTTQKVAMRDDGNGGDGAPFDGIYSLVLGYDSDGAYGIDVTAENVTKIPSFAQQGYLLAPDVDGHEPFSFLGNQVTEKLQRQARLQVTVTGLAASGGDDHADVPAGTPLPADNTEIAGRIDARGDLDYFSISNIPSGKPLAVRVTEQAFGLHPSLSLYRPDGTLIRSVQYSGFLILQPGEIVGGTVIARVSDALSGASGGTYHISAGPVLTSYPAAGPGVLALDDQPGDGRWQVTVHYESQAAGLSGDGHPVHLSSLGMSHGGLFWFFGAKNPELLVKVLNACSFNQKFWVFYAAGTDVGLTVTVRDTRTGRTKTYTNPEGRAAPPLQDTEAFDCTAADISGIADPGSTALAGTSAPAAASSPVSPSTGAPCVGDAHTLCIAQRFKVQVAFDSAARSGPANAISLASLGVDRGGLFWFFGRNNPELLIKVLDACSVNDQYWVFYAAGTDVGLTVTVTDTSNGNTKTYTNPRGTAALPVQDTKALPCN